MRSLFGVMFEQRGVAAVLCRCVGTLRVFFINLQTPPFKRNPGHVTGVAFLASVGDFEAARIGRRASVRVCSGGRGP